MAYNNPSIADFKVYFARDFPYGSDITTSVLDADLTKAMDAAYAEINPALFLSQTKYTIGFLLLCAHNLVMDLRSSSQGLSGQYAWIQNSKSVGSVSEGLTIPDRILANPEMAMLTKTNYGARYLYSILPLLAGNMASVCGRTQA